jgi:hypothetical protein
MTIGSFQVGRVREHRPACHAVLCALSLSAPPPDRPRSGLSGRLRCRRKNKARAAGSEAPSRQHRLLRDSTPLYQLQRLAHGATRMIAFWHFETERVAVDAPAAICAMRVQVAGGHLAGSLSEPFPCRPFRCLLPASGAAWLFGLSRSVRYATDQRRTHLGRFARVPRDDVSSEWPETGDNGAFEATDGSPFRQARAMRVGLFQSAARMARLESVCKCAGPRRLPMYDGVQDSMLTRRLPCLRVTTTDVRRSDRS